MTRMIFEQFADIILIPLLFGAGKVFKRITRESVDEIKISVDEVRNSVNSLGGRVKKLEASSTAENQEIKDKIDVMGIETQEIRDKVVGDA